jgi:hypothetical protein
MPDPDAGSGYQIRKLDPDTGSRYQIPDPDTGSYIKKKGAK